ncbi:M48 family metallopeptidase [Tundrisphaera lichenicola]|uniref:M48 family metallopeptidase n=1 Tax=Tundrisphaera lichenicola TaxID=2029860 RepID=UPI003EC012D4
MADEGNTAPPPEVGAVAHDPVPVPVPSDQALRFYRTGFWLWGLGRIWGIAVPALILFSGFSGRIRRLAEGRGRPWVVTIGLYAVIYLLVEYLIDFPLRYYSGFVRLHEYGLSVESFGRWLGDSLKGLGVQMAGAVLFLWIPYLLIARRPRRWWISVGVFVMIFAAFSAFLAPIVIDPIFNEFGPMKDARLESKIEALARRSGIEGGKIFEVDKSRETTTVNAYVTGLFGTKRIVLWDTLLAKLDEDEVLAVMGHEMGHYALNHVAMGLALSSFGTFFALFLISRAAHWLIGKYHRRFGFDRLSDVASVPLILMLAQVTMLLGSPVINAFSRGIEHEADRFALEITRNNHAAASAFAKLQRDNLSIPYPDAFSKFWRSSHPPIGERIEFCNDYRPWETGEPLRYGGLFREP